MSEEIKDDKTQEIETPVEVKDPLTGKDPKKSRTVIFGFLVTLMPFIAKLSPTVAAFLKDNQGFVLAVIGIVVVVLRKLTGDKLDLDKIFKA